MTSEQDSCLPYSFLAIANIAQDTIKSILTAEVSFSVALLYQGENQPNRQAIIDMIVFLLNVTNFHLNPIKTFFISPS